MKKLDDEQPAKRYFEFNDGKSSKFWEISHQGSEMTTRWGKIGTGGQSKTKSFATPEKAAAETAKIIATKVKEGYVEQSPSGAAVAPVQSSKIKRPKASTGWSDAADPELMLGQVLPSASDRKRRLYAVACCRRVEDWLVVESGLVLDMRVEDYQNAIDAAERFSDGKVTAEEMRGAFWSADDSAFCNESVEDATADEMRKATYGDDAGWKDRLRPEMSAESWRELEALPDPATWFEDEDNAGDLPSGVDPFRDVADKDAARVGETIGRQILLVVRGYGGRPRESKERKAQAALIRDIFGDPFPPPKFEKAWRTPDVASLAESIYEDKAFDRMPILGDALEEAGCDDPVILGHCRGTGPHVRGCWVLDLVLGKE